MVFQYTVLENQFELAIIAKSFPHQEEMSLRQSNFDLLFLVP